jgi:hypothetical protein
MTIAGCHVIALLVYESFFVLSTDLTAAYAIAVLAVNSYPDAPSFLVISAPALNDLNDWNGLND